MSPNTIVPTFDAMMLPTVQALQQLGGSGNTDEIYAKVTDLLKLSDEVLAISHLQTLQTSQSEVQYRLAWSRTYLKKYGVVENLGRGVWAISASAGDLTKLDAKEIVRSVREADKATSSKVSRAANPAGISATQEGVISTSTVSQPTTAVEAISDIPEEASEWNIELHNVLLALSPSAFERLVQRLLRESGFVRVEVTGQSGDGGIDGIGIARIHGFLSFQVLFQAKRYQGSVGSSQIRDFRGAMQGRTDKGLFITSGTFTREAVKEATRDGAPPIDLIDGEQLVHRLKELRLGVKIEMVESVTIDNGWFEKL